MEISVEIGRWRRRRRAGGRLWASPWSPLRAWTLRGRGNGLRFAPTEREFGGAGPNGCAAWPRHAWTWRSYRATELHVMVLGPTSGRAGGRTLEGLCGSRDRPADRPTCRFPLRFDPGFPLRTDPA